MISKCKFLGIVHQSKCAFQVVKYDLPVGWWTCCLVTKSYLQFCDPMDWVHQLLLSWDFPGKTTGVGCHFLLQGIFQELNLCLLHWQADSLPQATGLVNCKNAIRIHSQLISTFCGNQKFNQFPEDNFPIIQWSVDKTSYVLSFHIIYSK